MDFMFLHTGLMFDQLKLIVFEEILILKVNCLLVTQTIDI